MKTDVQNTSRAINHRRSVGPSEYYDLFSGMQFSVLFSLGLKEHDRLLDIGCGSLRAGKLLIPYLGVGNYVGIEPNEALVSAGIDAELSRDLITAKKPLFVSDDSLTLTKAGGHFDFLLATSVLSHAPLNMIEHCFKQAAAIMGATSQFVFTYCEGSADYQGTDWVDPGRVHFRPSTISDLLDRAGLESVQLDLTPRTNQIWLVATLRSGGMLPRLTRRVALTY